VPGARRASPGRGRRPAPAGCGLLRRDDEVPGHAARLPASLRRCPGRRCCSRRAGGSRQAGCGLAGTLRRAPGTAPCQAPGRGSDGAGSGRCLPATATPGSPPRGGRARQRRGRRWSRRAAAPPVAVRRGEMPAQMRQSPQHGASHDHGACCGRSPRHLAGPGHVHGDDDDDDCHQDSQEHPPPAGAGRYGGAGGVSGHRTIAPVGDLRSSQPIAGQDTVSPAKTRATRAWLSRCQPDAGP
jgi:hypothetical protein